MPYIRTIDAEALKQGNVDAANPGELNYMITKLLVKYVKDKGTKYSVLNDVMGALTGAQQEFYERVVRPYEDEKRNSASNEDPFKLLED